MDADNIESSEWDSNQPEELNREPEPAPSTPVPEASSVPPPSINRSRLGEENTRKIAAKFDAAINEIEKVILGQTELIEAVLIALFAEGNVLIEGVPGLGKTLLVTTLSNVLSCGSKRIQFTPDLMPTDVTGTSIYNTRDQEFHFSPGPLFTNILLADEINRAPAKTQSALLEAMQEHQVSVDGTTHQLIEPFITIATQNPIEQEGTYPLPEAQLDRFMFNVKVGYPNQEEEEQILTATTTGVKKEVRKVLTAKSILYLQKQINMIECSPLTISYVARLVRATRPADEEALPFVREMVDWGAGPRAGQYLIAGAKARAAMDGRPCVSLDDVRGVAIPVLRHRISTNFQAQAEGMTTDDVIMRLVEEVPEPSVPKYVEAAE